MGRLMNLPCKESAKTFDAAEPQGSQIEIVPKDAATIRKFRNQAEVDRIPAPAKGRPAQYFHQRRETAFGVRITAAERRKSHPSMDREAAKSPGNPWQGRMNRDGEGAPGCRQETRSVRDHERDRHWPGRYPRAGLHSRRTKL